jgi:hypothetical protein
MKNFAAMLALLLTSSSAFAANQSIPKAYQGTWSDVKTNCASKPFDTDSGYLIDDKSINQHEQSCKLKKVIKDDAYALKASYDCSEEDQIYPKNMTLRLSKDKKQLSVDGRKLVRCK